MRVLFTNTTLAGRAGTELYVRDVARRLQALGHTVVAWSTELGVVAEELRRAGIPVVSDLTQLPFTPDIIHGQHHLDTMTALLCLPGVPAVYVCHGAIPWEERPPVFPRIRRYVAVDQPCFERLAYEHGIPEAQILVLLNFVDLQRFQPRPPLPPKPARALVYTRVQRPEPLRAIRAACAQAGIAVELAGDTARNPTDAPEQLLPRFDLVFAKARAVLEALATGCAVIVFDGRGCGPLVTLRDFDRLRRLNFGYRVAGEPVTPDFLAQQIAQYDPADAAAVSRRVREEADLTDTATQLVRLYETILAEHRAQPSDPAAELRAAGGYLQSLLPVLKRAPKGGPSSKHRLFEALARKADKISRWLRA